MTTYDIDALQRLLETPAELDPELADYLDVSEQGWTMIRHPLVYSVLHTDVMNAMVNEQLKWKREALREALVKRDWSKYVYLYERPYRINAFSEICWQMGDSRYWELLGDIWTDTENLWQNEELWVEMLTAQRRYRSHLMTPAEREALAHDIDEKDGVVYRGFKEPGRQLGLSWTTNPIVAKFFARRLADKSDTQYLAKGRVDRKDVIAFFDGRSEYEVVVLPQHVRDIEITVLTGDG